jgi:hypothetical protein
VELTVRRWLERANDPSNVEFIICYDEGDTAVCNNIIQLVADASLKHRSIRGVPNTGPKNCVSGWNTAASRAAGDIIICVADDFDVPVHWDKGIIETIPWGWWKNEIVMWVKDGYNPDLLTLAILTRRRYERFGYVFYPGYQSLFCLPPDTPIYMANQTFKAIRDIVPGDMVVGSSRRPGRGVQPRDFLQPSKVLEVHKKRDRVVKLTLKSGKTLLCTPDHVWAYYGDTRQYLRNEKGKILRTTAGYARQRGFGQIRWGEPKIGRKLLRVLETPPPAPTDPESVRDLGWLAGMYDGEGSFPCISQSLDKNPEVCAEIGRVLRRLGFQFSTDRSYGKYRGAPVTQQVFTLTGGREEYLKFLAWTRPVRTFKKQVSKRMFTSRYGSPDEIVSIEPTYWGLNDDDNTTDVYCLSTETKNYVADGYLSHNSDTEFTYVASQDRVIVDARHLLFEHMHPDCGKRPRDEVDLKHASMERWNFGETLFNFRKNLGFPLDDGPRSAEYAAVPVRYAVVVQAIRDDLCLFEVCQRILEEGIKLSKTTELQDRIENVFLFAPSMRWDGAPANEDERQEVSKIADRLNIWLNKWLRENHPDYPHPYGVEFIPFEVAKVANVRQERIKVETDCRNWYQRFCGARGFQHTIIMDGDELWRPGMLARMNEMVRERWPMSVFTGMVPVAGLPGYPIEGALDKATIYARTDATFEHCRGTYGYRHELFGYDIYHFSATRKTLDEIAGKHLGSGHADDKNYRMQEWVDGVLMKGKLVPGYRNAHMYVQGPNVWPLIRNWTMEEWVSLPDSVKKYLGPPNTP